MESNPILSKFTRLKQSEDKLRYEGKGVDEKKGRSNSENWTDDKLVTMLSKVRRESFDF